MALEKKRGQEEFDVQVSSPPSSQKVHHANAGDKIHA